jgi:nicotinamide mononucleotide (NMN) deamidase PncC
MNTDIRLLIEAIHRSPHKLVLAASGGGATVAGLLLNVPGGSRTVLEVVIPYSPQAFAEFLGRVPEQFCSTPASRAIAARAQDRARWLAPRESVIGVGCTASLATDRPKQGDHRFHITTQTDEQITTYSLTLQKGARQREVEEEVLDTVLLNALAQACGLSERLHPDLLPEEVLQVETTDADLLFPFLIGRISTVCVEVDGKIGTDAALPGALLPGAFNPVHEGHWRLADVAARQLGTPVAFELSVLNVDKPPLVSAELHWRIDQFAWRAPVWLTRAPTFEEKASLFPGIVFVVGVDTAARIVAPGYYPAGEAGVSAAMSHIRRQGCRFLVAGRHDHQGRFMSLEELHLQAECLDLFTAIPESAFCVPVSSTALRERAESSQLLASPNNVDES